MKKITSVEELRETIQLLEIKQTYDESCLREQIKKNVAELTPAMLIKKALHNLSSSPDLKGNLFDTSISIAAGFLSKKLAVGSTHNPLKQLLGTILQVSVTSIVAKNTSGIKSIINNLISNLFNQNNVD